MPLFLPEWKRVEIEKEAEAINRKKQTSGLELPYQINNDYCTSHDRNGFPALR